MLSSYIFTIKPKIPTLTMDFIQNIEYILNLNAIKKSGFAQKYRINTIKIIWKHSQNVRSKVIKIETE